MSSNPMRPKDASASSISFARIAQFPPPGWQTPRHIRFSPNGKLVTYLQRAIGSQAGGAEGKSAEGKSAEGKSAEGKSAEGKSAEMALFAFDLDKGEHRVLLRASDLVDKDRPMSREEELRRERQRKRITGVTSYSWADKADAMLLPLGGDIYIRQASGTVTQLTSSEAPEIDPKLCADGSKVAFVRGSELFVIDVATKKEKQLTKDAPSGVTRGQSDFNGQEEFSEPSGLWWSPDCNTLAFLEVDEQAVGQVAVMGYRGKEDLQLHRYPRAGTTNPKTRLGLLDVSSGHSRWIDMPAASDFAADDQYLGRMQWRDDGKVLYFQRLSRSQQHLAVVRVDTLSGQAKHIIEERDDAWLDMSAMRVLPDGKLLWTALRKGHRHIEVRDGDSGKSLATLTQGAWDVSQLLGFDKASGMVMFVANKDAAIDRQLYRVRLEGGRIERLSKEAGVHLLSSGDPSRGYVDIHSANGRLPQAVIHGPGGAVKGRIAIALDDDFDKLGIRDAEMISIDDGKGPRLHGALLKPRDMQPGRRYPAVLMVYGGPGVQVIQNAYNPRLLWQHLADRGFVVVQIDNRGSTGRGHAFETPLYRNMGQVELIDQLRLLDYLGRLDFVASDHVGIYGHSYGGYMAAMAMLRAPGRFRAGVSGSPVTDWRLYDTGYTERFMGTPQDNAKGYADSEITQHASGLEGKLLIIHALMDENVHFAHTAKLIDALVAADKDFDLMVFPGERHGYRSPAARRYAYRRVVDYFVAHLAGQ
jgi:dipeptidyl-peptidase-4